MATRKQLVKIVYTVQYSKLLNIDVSKDLEHFIFGSGSPNISDDPDMIEAVASENQELFEGLPIPAPKTCLVHNDEPVIQEIHFNVKEI